MTCQPVPTTVGSIDQEGSVDDVRVRRQPGGRASRLVGGLTVVVALLCLGGTIAAAPSPSQSRSDDEMALELAERFAPVMMLKQQEVDCDADGEPYRPGSVDILLGNPEVALRQVGPGDPVVKRAPTATDLAGLGEGFFLDFPGSALEPKCVYERDFRKYTDDMPATIYAHLVRPPGEPDLLVVQYWFYWYYNDWNNKHESDWEGISLLFEASTVEEALRSGPVLVGYSQHEGGERADWGDEKLEREGDRPIVYPSAGSHASYFGSAVYLGRGASEGFGCDDTTGPSERIAPEVVLLPDEVDDPSDPLAWLSFEGRWGERQGGPFNGPTGPSVKDRWLDPMPWFEELRDSSVVIPAGESQAASLIGVFCSAVEGGSTTLINFTVSPTSVIVSALILVVLLRWAAGRTDWARVVAEPVRLRRRAGQIVHTSAAIYARAPLAFILFGLIYLPAAFVTGLLVVVLHRMPIVGPLLELFAGATGTNLFTALLVGSFANVAAAVFVHAVVADYLRSGGHGVAVAVDSARRIWDRRAAVVGGFVRSFVIVALLLLTIVGVPWAIRQLVRYQFFTHAIVFDGADGSSSLARSSELVKGRWWHTAIVVAAFNALIGATALVVALLVLVVATGWPLWVFSVVVSLTYALVVPIAAIAMTLLYGDAVAQSERGARAELVSADR